MNKDQYLRMCNTFVYQDDLVRINVHLQIETSHTGKWRSWGHASNYVSQAMVVIPSFWQIAQRIKKQILKIEVENTYYNVLKQINRFKNPLAQKCMRLIYMDRGVLYRYEI